MNIYIIAGPPGIGKSTSGKEYIPENTTVIDHDLAAYQYKKEGFVDYKELGIMSGNQQIKSCLFTNEDFALELNLGFQSHYDYLKSLAYFDHSNKVNLILFFTESENLCLDRAEGRYKNGGHLVEPSIVKEMYKNTIPLLLENLKIFRTFTFVDIKSKSIQLVNKENLPNWIIQNDLEKYI